MERNVPVRPIDQLNAFAAELHRQRRDWQRRVHRWQWLAISSAAGSLLGVIIALAYLFDAHSDLDRNGRELVTQLEETLKLMRFMQSDLEALGGEIQDIEWRLDRDRASRIR